MEKKPEVRSIRGGKIWSKTFETFEGTVYVPDNELDDEILNYGFVAPFLVVLPEKKLSEEEMVDFSDSKGFTKIAKDFASSVLFVYPTAEGGWKNAPDTILGEVITNSKIHQYYEDGMARVYNRFTKEMVGYYIRGALFRICMYGFGESADYIATKGIRHFEGDGLWGRADCAPCMCTMSGLTTAPIVTARDIPVVSYGNEASFNNAVTEGADYYVIKDSEDIYNDFYKFGRKFRRMLGQLELDPDLEGEGMKIEPGIFETETSSDNAGDDAGTATHKIGYFAFYNSGLFDNGPAPLLISFHGGGDSAMYIAHVSGWASVAHRNNFLLVSIENHLNSTATEMKALIEYLGTLYNIDMTRVYVSGFSMGGCKSWDMIQEYPEIIAAAAPMDATFEVGLNVFGQPAPKEINTTLSVPTFYVGGELTPLPELPFQAQKCLDRFHYLLKLNKVVRERETKLEDIKAWENAIWSLNGDEVYCTVDPARKGKLTIQLFLSEDGKCRTAMASVDNQGHECREHTCENAWRFMKNFSRSQGRSEGGDVETIRGSFTK